MVYLVEMFYAGRVDCTNNVPGGEDVESIEIESIGNFPKIPILIGVKTLLGCGVVFTCVQLLLDC